MAIPGHRWFIIFSSLRSALPLHRLLLHKYMLVGYRMTSPHMMSVVMTLSTHYLSADKDYMRRLPKNRTQAPRATQCDL